MLKFLIYLPDIDYAQIPIYLYAAQIGGFLFQLKITYNSSISLLASSEEHFSVGKSAPDGIVSSSFINGKDRKTAENSFLGTDMRFVERNNSCRNRFTNVESTDNIRKLGMVFICDICVFFKYLREYV